MITAIEASQRHRAEHGWLHTYHLFSFADYYDPHNTHFGTLCVFNDDTIDVPIHEKI
jgi:redox-sensitive bicupin YhaK (pirin superfamily)